MDLGDVVLAILAKDKAHVLPLFLRCIKAQTYPKNKIHLYIRTNNNNDNTSEILRKWVNKNQKSYASVHYDDKDVKDKVQEFGQHEWNSLRFFVLGKIREASVKHAEDRKMSYFVVDCDNFITPDTLMNLYISRLPVVAPMLTTVTTVDKEHGSYSNYHNVADANGYFQSNNAYYPILQRRIKGLIRCDVVHCTYFIRDDIVPKIKYLDGTKDYEYVIFSRNLRNLGIPQYLDNSQEYGTLTFVENKENFDKEGLEKVMAQYLH